MWGYLEYRGGCSVPGGYLLLFESHATEHLPRYSWYPPTVLKLQRMISLTLLNTPHGTQDIPPLYCTTPTVLHTRYTGWLVCREITEDFPKIFSRNGFRLILTKLELKWYFISFRKLSGTSPKIFRQLHSGYTTKLLLTMVRSVGSRNWLVRA